MAKAELGIKRLCGSCGMRFYDFKRSPIVCPGCSTEFDPNHIVKSRKSRSASKASEKAAAALDIDDALDISDDDLDDDLDDQADVDINSDDDNDDDLDFDEDDLDVDDADGPGIIQDDLGDGDELIPSLDEKEE
jgi:uncharacterized protein (TIGR02300 family)